MDKNRCHPFFFPAGAYFFFKKEDIGAQIHDWLPKKYFFMKELISALFTPRILTDTVN